MLKELGDAFLLVIESDLRDLMETILAFAVSALSTLAESAAPDRKLPLVSHDCQYRPFF